MVLNNLVRFICFIVCTISMIVADGTASAAEPPYLINISTRGQVQTGDSVMIGGFIIRGDSPKTVLIRAIGPTLSAYGVTGVLANPKLDLYAGPNKIGSNDDWGASNNAAAIQATGLAPVSPLESAILIELPPGPYTAVISGVSDGTGVALVEVIIDFQTSHAAGMLARTNTIGIHPEISYKWVSLNLLPALYPDSLQWWTGINNLIKSRNASAKIVSYHSGNVINQEFIPDYDSYSKYVGGQGWTDSLYLKNSLGNPVRFDDHWPGLYYVDITNPTARKFIADVAKGMMKKYFDTTGVALDGVFFDFVEWKPRSMASPYMFEQAYRTALITIFNEVRTGIRIYNPSAEVGGNAGAIRDHSDFSILNQLDTVFSENTFGIAFSGRSDDEKTLTDFLNQNDRSKLLVGIDGDYLGWGAFMSQSCPSLDRYQRAQALAKIHATQVLITADFGPGRHGDLDCWKSEYFVW